MMFTGPSSRYVARSLTPVGRRRSMDKAGHPIETGTVTPVAKGHPHRASRHWVRAVWRVTPAMLHPHGGHSFTGRYPQGPRPRAKWSRDRRPTKLDAAMWKDTWPIKAGDGDEKAAASWLVALSPSGSRNQARPASKTLPATASDRLAVANCPPGESWAGLLA